VRTNFRLFAVIATMLSACVSSEAQPAAHPAARLIQRFEGFDGPESVRYDADQDVYFVSNILGYGSEKDGRGYISRITAGTPSIEMFVQSGVRGVVLDAPKGLGIQGDTLWTADIDVLRGFHRRTGAPVGEIDLRPFGAVMANDVALGPDGMLYVTDTGIEMSRAGVFYHGSEKIFRISAGRTVSVLASGSGLRFPNGITWDPAGKRWIVVSFDPFDSEIYVYEPGSSRRTVLAQGPGRFDGVEVLGDGRILATSWADSSLHVIQGDAHERVILNLWQPADLGVDTRRQRVAIPLVLQGRVEVWELPPP
jgi:DNA-binding beta-propeller fold protein YncE